MLNQGIDWVRVAADVDSVRWMSAWLSGVVTTRCSLQCDACIVLGQDASIV
jgi:hypothetical protein